MAGRVQVEAVVRFARLLGAATALYGAVVVIRPGVLAAPCGLAESDGSVSPAVRTLVGGIGARDAAIGAAMVSAPVGAGLRVAIAARVASDVGDALVFGLTLPDPRARKKVVAVATAWAALCALSALQK